jgi:hypothetical protein
MKFVINSSEAKSQSLAQISAIDLAARPIQTVEIRAFKKDRTSKQNRYYHGVVLKTISDYTGYSQGELHELFKSNLLPSKVIVIADKQVEYTQSTTELTTAQFERYISEIVQFASDSLSLYIPDPNEDINVPTRKNKNLSQ